MAVGYVTRGGMDGDICRSLHRGHRGRLSSDNVPAMSAPSVIRLDGVRKAYGSIEALRGVSLTVAQGEIFGLLGPNGAGKSTLIKTLVGFTRPNAGSVEVLGLHPIARAAELRRKIGYMPQAPVLYEDLSARDNVRFFGQAHVLPDLDRRVDDVLALIGLADRQRDAVY